MLNAPILHVDLVLLAQQPLDRGGLDAVDREQRHTGQRLGVQPGVQSEARNLTGALRPVQRQFAQTRLHRRGADLPVQRDRRRDPGDAFVAGSDKPRSPLRARLAVC